MCSGKGKPWKLKTLDFEPQDHGTNQHHDCLFGSFLFFLKVVEAGTKPKLLDYNGVGSFSGKAKALFSSPKFC